MAASSVDIGLTSRTRNVRLQRRGVNAPNDGCRAHHTAAAMLPCMSELHVVHEDAAIVVVNKPSGLLSVLGRGAAGLHNLTSLVQAVYVDALAVHRLDMGTSGLMVFARGPEVHRQLSKAFADRQVHKRYVAIVEGVVTGDGGSIDAPLVADWPRRPLQKVDHEVGKPSLTHWQVQQRTADSTRLLLTPVTGRSHQLRVHLQSIGHPIRGDELYAPHPLRANRLLLHAQQLSFSHPETQQALCFFSEPEF
jgi:tRNA pseudouridine32 synthase / 23S rRNA pseudouridine746 synthase